MPCPTIVLIPYITIEDDTAEVWIQDYPDDWPPLRMARQALQDFADETDPEAIRDHLATWQVTRILLPEPDGRWRAFGADRVLDGRLDEDV